MLQENLNLNDFKFHVPKKLIAQNPLENRSDTRLLVYHQNQKIEHSQVDQFDQVIPENSLLLVNDTRVMPCRLKVNLSSGKRLEFLLLEKPRNSNGKTLALAIAKPSKSIELGSKVFFANKLLAQVLEKTKLPYGWQFLLEFSYSQAELLLWMEEHGYVPLPPYIQRQEAKTASKSDDSKLYQTIFAQEHGSSAAPTAGLHFTEEIITRLKKKNVRIYPITLHIGAGTFSPVREEEIEKHHMHYETYLVPQKTLEALKTAKQEKRRIIAVGTSTFRALESFYHYSQASKKEMSTQNQWLKTNLFIYPSSPNFLYKPYWIDALITNFHQPQSTLFMLICSLLGYQKARDLYNEAIKNHYRFYSYGDNSILWL